MGGPFIPPISTTGTGLGMGLVSSVCASSEASGLHVSSCSSQAGQYELGTPELCTVDT